MKTRLLRVTTALLLIAGLYLGLSFLVLDGKITYWTSSNRFTIEDSKTDNYFATDSLTVISDGDSLNDWESKFDVWTNFRTETKYYGFLLHWEFNDPSWRYLNLAPKTTYVNDKWFRRKLIVNDREFDYMKSFTGGWESCYTPVKCKVNDTVRIEFTHAIMQDSTLGSITVIVK